MENITQQFIDKVTSLQLTNVYGHQSGLIDVTTVIQLIEEFEVALLNQTESNIQYVKKGENY